MPVIRKPKDRGPLYGGRTVILFGKWGARPKPGTSDNKAPDPKAVLKVKKVSPNAP